MKDRSIEAQIEESLRRGQIDDSATWTHHSERYAKVYEGSVSLIKKYRSTVPHSLLVHMASQAQVSPSGILYCKTSERILSSETGLARNTISRALKLLEGDGEITRYISEHNDPYYIISPSSGVEKFDSESLRSAFVSDMQLLAKANERENNGKCETSNDDSGPAQKLGHPQDIAVAQKLSHPPEKVKNDAGVAQNLNFSDQNLSRLIIDKKEKNTKTTTTDVSSCSISKYSKENASTKKSSGGEGLELHPWNLVNILSLVNNSTNLPLTDDGKLSLLEKSGQVWVLNRALSILDRDPGNVRKTPLSYVLGIIKTILEEVATVGSPIYYRGDKQKRPPRLNPTVVGSPKAEISTSPIGLSKGGEIDPFRRDFQNLTCELFDRGEISEDEARARFSNIGCDFDAYRGEQITGAASA